MDQFAPPPGPPPPRAPEVPSGWKAVYNEQYKEWFYVNIYTKKSSWEKPTEPVYPHDESAPAGPPPSYSGGGAGNFTDSKTNPYDHSGAASSAESDEALARRLQAEEDTRARGSGFQASQQNYQSSPTPQDSRLPPREEKKGLLGKILGKVSSPGGSRPIQGYQSQQQGYGQQYPQQQYQQYPQQYQQYPQQYQQYPQQYGGYQQPPRKSGGMSSGAGLALGAGGGLLGGMLLADAMQDHDQNEYQDGYQDGQNADGGDYGGGGDDGGGGDF